MRARSRRSFLGLAAGAVAAVGGWRWLTTRPRSGEVPYPLRRVLELNEGVAEEYFSDDRLAPRFARALAREPRVNGDEGLSDGFDPGAWRLHAESAGVRRTVSLQEIRALPRVEMTTELKCIEGWSVVVSWTGARLRDFAAAYGVGGRGGSAPGSRGPRDLLKYVSLETPDRSYYVGMDVASAMHPQTLLCYEMNGAPLTLPHGAPLRLVTTVKYGI